MTQLQQTARKNEAQFLKSLDSAERHMTSWSLCAPGFEKILARLRSKPPVEDDTHKFLSESSGKFVWRVCDSEDGCSYDFAYKTQNGKKPWRYLFRSSLPVRECRNYSNFEELGIPVAEVLAVGDTRRFFRLIESFLVTRFIENTRDGRAFMENGEFHKGHDSLREEFCRINMKLLAKIHDADYYHKAFHPRNLLWRGGTDEPMEVFWIDVARCRRFPRAMMHKAMIVDLHTFFRDMKMKRSEVLATLQCYVECRPEKNLSADRLLQELLSYKRRLFSRKTYTIHTG